MRYSVYANRGRQVTDVTAHVLRSCRAGLVAGQAVQFLYRIGVAVRSVYVDEDQARHSAANRGVGATSFGGARMAWFLWALYRGAPPARAVARVVVVE